MEKKALEKWKRYCDTIDADSVAADHELSSISSELNTKSKDSAACTSIFNNTPAWERKPWRSEKGTVTRLRLTP